MTPYLPNGEPNPEYFEGGGMNHSTRQKDQPKPRVFRRKYWTAVPKRMTGIIMFQVWAGMTTWDNPIREHYRDSMFPEQDAS